MRVLWQSNLGPVSYPILVLSQLGLAEVSWKENIFAIYVPIFTINLFGVCSMSQIKVLHLKEGELCCLREVQVVQGSPFTSTCQVKKRDEDEEEQV